jgi:hypothetical protein
MSHGVVLFPSVHFALRAEKLMKQRGIPFKLIPVPRHISSDCGICLRFSWDQREEVEAVLKEAKVNVEGIHRLGNDPPTL